MTFFNLGDLIPSRTVYHTYQTRIYLTIIVFHKCESDMRWYRAVAKISSCQVYAISRRGFHRKEVLLVLFSFGFLWKLPGLTLIVAREHSRAPALSESPVVDSQWGAQHRVGYNHSHIQKQAKWINNYCFIKTPTKYWEFFPTLFVKTTNFQLVFNFEQTCTVAIFGEHGTCIMSHTPW